MRIFLLIIGVLFSSVSFSQGIPADSAIIKKIVEEKEIQRKLNLNYIEGEDANQYYDSITYVISFKERVLVEDQQLLLVICDEPIFTQSGNTWWYRNFYYFNEDGRSLKIIKPQEDGEETLIGDVNEFLVVEIGKNKKALISTFLSRENSQTEKNIIFYYLSKDSITYLFSIDIEFSNETLKKDLAVEDDNIATSFESTYQIIKSDKEWFDVKVHKVNYGFTNGYKKRFVESEEDIMYSYNGLKYIATPKQLYPPEH